MKKLIALVLAWVCVFGLVSCSKTNELQQGDNNMQYFFSAKVIDVDEAYLLLEVFDTGNSNLSEGAKIEVSTDTVSADGCPEFVIGEYARVLMARNTDNNPPSRLEALPEPLRTKIQNDSSYITYLAKSIEEELLAYDRSSHISSALSKKINDIIHDESSESLKDTVIKSTLKVFDTKVNEILEDGIIDEKEEEEAISDYIKKTALEGTLALIGSSSYIRLIQSLVLRDLQEGKKSNRCTFSELPVLIGKTENVIWVYRNVTCYEEKSGRKYISGNSGVSMKICKGVYYRIGATKGHSVPYQYNDNLGIGLLIITSKNIIFSGYKPVKIPINKVISFTTFSDGIELFKEAANPKHYTFTGCDAWFIVNAIQLLAP